MNSLGNFFESYKQKKVYFKYSLKAFLKKKKKALGVIYSFIGSCQIILQSGWAI